MGVWIGLGALVLCAVTFLWICIRGDRRADIEEARRRMEDGEDPL